VKIVIPFFDGNKAIAVKLCRWIGHLDGSLDTECILIGQSNCDASDLVSAASGVFSKVAIHSYDVMGPHQWPFGKNSAWQSAAWLMSKSKEPWLWLEPDAIPLVNGWFQKIEKLHTDGKMPFSGFILPGLKQLEGVAVYPPDVAHYGIEAMLCRAAPFDQVSGKNWAFNTTPLNGLFAYQHDVDGQPVSFKDESSVSQLIPKDAILFHRCKDGSLIDVLSRGVFHRIADAVAQLVQVKPEEAKPSDDTVDTCIVLLGRYGDIINILPVVADMKPRVALMVAKQFADVLDGVTYCQKEVFDGGLPTSTRR